jgi:hypothetical protein
MNAEESWKVNSNPRLPLANPPNAQKARGNEDGQSPNARESPHICWYTHAGGNGAVTSAPT